MPTNSSEFGEFEIICPDLSGLFLFLSSSFQGLSSVVQNKFCHDTCAVSDQGYELRLVEK